MILLELLEAGSLLGLKVVDYFLQSIKGERLNNQPPGNSLIQFGEDGQGEFSKPIQDEEDGPHAIETTPCTLQVNLGADPLLHVRQGG